jgi:hypothetical protein
MSYTIERTLKGRTVSSNYDYEEKYKAMKEWDKAVENAIGGDKLRLIGPHGPMSEYNPVDRSGT